MLLIIEIKLLVRLWLRCIESNKKLNALYKKNGFLLMEKPSSCVFPYECNLYEMKV